MTFLNGFRVDKTPIYKIQVFKGYNFGYDLIGCLPFFIM